jgi:hypothetical protein
MCYTHTLASNDYDCILEVWYHIYAHTWLAASQEELASDGPLLLFGSAAIVAVCLRVPLRSLLYSPALPCPAPQLLGAHVLHSTGSAVLYPGGSVVTHRQPALPLSVALHCTDFTWCVCTGIGGAAGAARDPWACDTRDCRRPLIRRRRFIVWPQCHM